MTKWISVKKKMPSEKSPVLITDGDLQYVGWIEGDIFFYSYCCGCVAENITHWMLLPEPPTEDK